LSQDDASQEMLFRTLVKIDPEDGEATVLNFDGTESVGADIRQLMDKIENTIRV
jgi:hypothetical protein